MLVLRIALLRLRSDDGANNDTGYANVELFLHPLVFLAAFVMGASNRSMRPDAGLTHFRPTLAFDVADAGVCAHPVATTPTGVWGEGVLADDEALFCGHG